MSITGRAREHVDRFNRAVVDGDWQSFAAGFATEAIMRFTNVPAGPFLSRAAIQAGYEHQPPDDTMRVTAIEPVDADADAARVRFAWSRGGSGVMLLRWRGDEIVLLEIGFDT